MSRLLVALAVPAILAIVQQQVLVRQPPRLQRLHTAPASSGPAALQARFSRPIPTEELIRWSRLDPAYAHRWLGEGDELLLTLDPGQQLAGPLTLELAGQDRAGLALAKSRWLWDPRSRVVAVVPVQGGEQVQVREHDGSWQALTPVWPQIPLIEALGDGSALGVASRDEQGGYRVWRVPLRQRNLVSERQGLAPVEPGPVQSLSDRPALFAHLSGNRRGELLVQTGGLLPGEARIHLWPPRGRGRPLDLEATGPLRLLPQGGIVVVPGKDGLTLHDLPPRPPRQQTLPGSRDLSSFCPQAGRALLLRHWPDYRRSLELVEPGQPPRQLWLGEQALLASACSRGGERVWALLVEGTRTPELIVLALDRTGRVLRRQPLPGWELEPGTGLEYDPSSDRLLATLRRLVSSNQPPPMAEAVVIDAERLEVRPLGHPARQSLWLPAG